MKKTIVATALVAGFAMTSLAEVASQNIVGFMDSSLPVKDSYLMIAPTFLKVGENKDLTLKDLTVVHLDTKTTATQLAAGNNLVNMWGASGDPLLVIDDETLADKFPDVYAKYETDEVTELAFTYDSAKGHWYMNSDTLLEFPMDDYPIVEGRGFYLNAGRALAKGMKMTTAGEVAKGVIDIVIPTKDSYAMTGNIAAKTLTLSEYAVKINDTKTTATQLAAGNNLVNMWGASGDPLLVIDDDTLADKFPDVYAKYETDEVTELAFTFDTAKSHWYMNSDTLLEFPMDTYPLTAGRGFYLNAGRALAKGLTMRLPRSIEEDEE